MDFFDYGVLKTQRLSYKLWDEGLKYVETKDELIEFIHSHKKELEKFLSTRLPKSQHKYIFEDSKIKNNSTFDYLCETIKSGIFRAGGSNIMDWGLWRKSDNNSFTSFLISDNGLEEIYSEGQFVKIPIRYEVELPEKLHSDIKVVGTLIHEHIKKSTTGSKILTRIDFVPSAKDSLYLIDVGDTNLTMGITDGIYRLSSKKEGHILSTYIEKVLCNIKKEKGDISLVYLVVEDKVMLSNQPYEFKMLSNAITAQMDVDVQTITMEEFISSEINDNAGYIRCFGKDISDDLGAGFIDDAHAIKHYKKHNLAETLRKLEKEFPDSIKIPKIARIDFINGSVENIVEEIINKAKSLGFDDFIVKPSARCEKMLSPAFLYSILNESHKRQLKKVIERFRSEENVPYLLIEENVGKGFINDKKLEIRFFCMS